MANQFFDTSAAAKHYRVELGTPRVDALLAQAGVSHVISDLTVVEFHSVLARLTRTGQISASGFQSARGRFLADIVAGLWRVAPVAAAHYHRAQHLLTQHGLTQSLRTLDALQLAVALDLNAVTPLAAFVCADANLCTLALAEGLTVINPEVP
jgi:predicted nucleic acid-binding protein